MVEQFPGNRHSDISDLVLIVNAKDNQMLGIFGNSDKFASKFRVFSFQVNNSVVCLAEIKRGASLDIAHLVF